MIGNRNIYKYGLLILKLFLHFFFFCFVCNSQKFIKQTKGTRELPNPYIREKKQWLKTEQTNTKIKKKNKQTN